MAIVDTYRAEVLQSRRDRSRRALFWARLLGIVLMLTVGLTLRSEPDLRRALADAGMDAIARMAGRDAAAQGAQSPDTIAASSTGLRDRIKVNRPVIADTVDPQAAADDLGRSLSERRVSD